MRTLAIINFRNLYRALIPGLFAIFFWINPHGGIAGVEALSARQFWSCPFLSWTGFHCPGCGLTRSMFAFFSMDLQTCFYFHPLGPLLGFAALVFWFYSWVRKDFSPEQILKSLPRPVYFPSLVLLLAWGFFRNFLDL
jgi:hypothetical protein